MRETALKTLRIRSFSPILIKERGYYREKEGDYHELQRHLSGKYLPV
jgi:hypothetical protein